MKTKILLWGNTASVNSFIKGLDKNLNATNFWPTTFAHDFRTFCVDGQEVSIWNAAGHEAFPNILSHYFKNANAIIYFSGENDYYNQLASLATNIKIIPYVSDDAPLSYIQEILNFLVAQKLIPKRDPQVEYKTQAVKRSKKPIIKDDFIKNNMSVSTSDKVQNLVSPLNLSTIIPVQFDVEAHDQLIQKAPLTLIFNKDGRKTTDQAEDDDFNNVNLPDPQAW